MSNCSQRVRLALEEKGLPWTSHHLNLAENEHITPEYQSINPKGVVPSLVHDGQVVLESNDIILYLEDHFPEPALRPTDSASLELMTINIKLAGESQSAVKVLSYQRLFRGFKNVTDVELSLLAKEHSNTQSIRFMQDYADNGVVWEQRVTEAEALLATTLAAVEVCLQRQLWLSGSQYGLADISWIVNAHRLVIAKFPLHQYPAVNGWYQRVIERPTFQNAVLDYQE